MARLSVGGVAFSQDLLPVIDAFDAAAGQVKVETEGEKKIAESYQVRWFRPTSSTFCLLIRFIHGDSCHVTPGSHLRVLVASS